MQALIFDYLFIKEKVNASSGIELVGEYWLG